MHLEQHNNLIDHLIDNHVFGNANEWEKHEIGGSCAFVKRLESADAELKARIADKFHHLGFVPMFFKEHGAEFVALENVHEQASYQNIEEAFVQQILAKAK